jgi:hypothetical protein
MNLYAVCPAYGPYEFETEIFLAKSDEAAMQHGVFIAAHDACKGHCSPSAEVFVIARDVEKIGDAYATDAPARWEWAHPGVEEAAAKEACLEGSMPRG